MTTLSGPKRCPLIEDAPQQWVVNNAVQVWEGAVVGSYPSGANAGYLDLIEADPTLVCRGVARKNVLGDGKLNVEVDEKIIPLAFAGGLDTTKRGALVYAVDTATGTLTSGTPPIGMLMEVVSATKGMVGVGPSFVARAAAATAATLTSANAFQVDEWLAPAATSTTALKTATTISSSPQTVSTFVAGGVSALAAFPRNVTFTGGGTTADCPTSAAVTGTDIDGNALTETVTLTAGSGTGVKAFKTVTSVVFTGSSSNDSTVAIGIGSALGLSKTIKYRAHRLAVIQEVYAATTTGSVVTNGTYTDNTTSPPHGSYQGNSVPDGTRSYALTYEHS